MKQKYIVIILALCCCAFTSCFKDEPLNAECDIEEAYLHADEPEKMFFNATDSLVKVLYTESNIDFKVRKETDLTSLAPLFRITEGATITPANGSVHDFTNGPVVYTVTSEDGQWSKQYQVSVSIQTRIVSDTLYYDFEHYALNANNKYYVWTDINTDGTDANNWATGNPGFAISRSSALPDEYPSTPLIDGYDGAGVKLVTRDTGPFGKLKNMRLAAGNLFIGKFDATTAILADGAMKATMFGLKFTSSKRPVKFTGYYKYTPGGTYQDRDGNAVSGRIDTGNIYSVLYRNTDSNGDAVVLHGDDVLTNAQIVAIAKIDEVKNTDEWTPFEIDFNYTEDIDEALLENYGYNLTIVFSSSAEGASFAGAVGSTLCIDKVRIICEQTE